MTEILGWSLVWLATTAITFSIWKAWRKWMATQQQLTEAIGANTTAVIAATSAVNALIAAQGTIPDADVTQIAANTAALNTLTQAATAALNPTPAA